MNRRFVRRAVRALVFVAALAAPLTQVDGAEAAAGSAVSPLTNEDIVRMVASGTPERDILEAITTREVAFDVADDMVSELKLAGVSAPIIAAMRRRVAGSAPPPVTTEQPRKDRVHLVVTLNAGGAGLRTIKLPAWADENVKVRLKLPKENEQRAVKDVAVFLACSSPEHVPDLWRSKTPLGRDMVSVPRHEMLAFVAGDTPDGKAPRLTLPARIEADVDGSEPHDLILGVAARLGDHWMQIASATLSNTTVSGDKPISGLIERAAGAFEFKVKLKAP